MPPRPPPAPAEPELLGEILELGRQISHQLIVVSDAHGLTPQQVVMLRLLREPRAMRDIAAEMCCDPSNVTGLIDRMEARGLVARTPGPGDRRVKLLSLTAEGRALHKKVDADLKRHLLPQGGQSTEAMKAVKQLRGWVSPATEVPAGPLPTGQT